MQEFKLGLIGWDEKKGPMPITTLILDPSMGDVLPGEDGFDWHKLVESRLPESEGTKFFPITPVPGKKKRGKKVDLLSVQE